MYEEMKMIWKKTITKKIAMRNNMLTDLLQEIRIIFLVVKKLSAVVTTIIDVVHLVWVKLHVKMFSMVIKNKYTN